MNESKTVFDEEEIESIASLCVTENIVFEIDRIKVEGNSKIKCNF